MRQTAPDASPEAKRSTKHRLHNNLVSTTLNNIIPTGGRGGGTGDTIVEARSELNTNRIRGSASLTPCGIELHCIATRVAVTHLARLGATVSKVEQGSINESKSSAEAPAPADEQKPVASVLNTSSPRICAANKTITPPNPQSPFRSTVQSRMGYTSTHDPTHPSSSPVSWSELVASSPSQQQQFANAPSNSRPLERTLSVGTDVVDNTTSTKQFFDDDEKSMGHSVATAPTQTTGVSHVGTMHAEEDDATTIRSLDSIQEHDDSPLTEDYDEDTQHFASAAALAPASAVASSTCSVSTAPSTDEASSFGGVGNDWKQQMQHHRRVPSWEVSPHSQFSTAHDQRGNSPGAVHLPPSFSPAWGGPQQRVASFRGDQLQQQGYPVLAGRPMNGNNTSQWTNQHQTPPRYRVGDPSIPFLPSTVGARGGHDSPRSMFNRQAPPNSGYVYPPMHQQRKPYNQPPLPPSANRTPNERAAAGRGPHNSIVSAAGSPAKPPVGSQGGSRSASEVLKTLLRKKACLYEPDTSRAVALVTWLVGRELALQFGFFSRQQLQAGVHACVSTKIDAGIITRTKVNRCMQIILNSCFHYIIPRPDGTEESGDSFREVFAKEMRDDLRLLSVLPAPWNDISVNRSEILIACQDEDDLQRSSKNYETPHSSPQLGSIQDRSPGRESNDGDDGDASISKRAVLLCFNENVRQAEDVFRCHNEFIRDTAHACHLQMSSNEWRLFFGREAASTPYIWGNVGIPIPFMEGQGPAQTDALGVLTRGEVAALRTSWCCKRYDHDHELCGFAHSQVNCGWLRRDPSTFRYKDVMCQYVSSISVPSNRGGIARNVLVLNECPYGVDCEFAHATEEIVYHPNRYKQRPCASLGRPGGCSFSDVCPNFHPADSYRFPKKADGRSPRHSRHAQHHISTRITSPSSPNTIPFGSPIVYASPAPVSSFERHLLTPGLQSLYRRNCSVFRATLRGGVAYECLYSYFGDDTGIGPKKVRTQSNAIGPSQHV